VRRLVSDTFVPHFKSTIGVDLLVSFNQPCCLSILFSMIGVDFGVKKMEVDKKPVTLHLWDIAGMKERVEESKISFSFVE
jgi:hypothetical protein